jgi:hypothetical protein
MVKLFLTASKAGVLLTLFLYSGGYRLLTKQKNPIPRAGRKGHATKRQKPAECAFSPWTKLQHREP